MKSLNASSSLVTQPARETGVEAEEVEEAIMEEVDEQAQAKDEGEAEKERTLH